MKYNPLENEYDFQEIGKSFAEAEAIKSTANLCMALFVIALAIISVILVDGVIDRYEERQSAKDVKDLPYYLVNHSQIPEEMHEDSTGNVQLYTNY
jgi:hypothetical protein